MCIRDRNNPKLLLWGDSHALQMVPMLTEVFPDVAVYEMTQPGCAPLFGEQSRKLLLDPLLCFKFNQRVLQEIVELKKTGLEGVVLSARWLTYFRHPSLAVEDRVAGVAPFDAQRLAQVRAEMQTSLDVTLTTLESMGLRVVVLAPIPQLFYSAPQCIVMRGESHCNVPRKLNEAMLADVTDALATVIRRHPNARLIESLDFFCDEQTCYASRDGKTLYYDDNHIISTSARALGRYLATDLAWLLGK